MPQFPVHGVQPYEYGVHPMMAQMMNMQRQMQQQMQEQMFMMQQQWMAQSAFRNTVS